MTTQAQFDIAFATERAVKYPAIDALEKEFGFSVDRDRLENAARVLACPVKVNPPNWQHGRVVYAVARNFINSQIDAVKGYTHQMRFLDIGTAKGFSALCASWAIKDGGQFGDVISVDVIDPTSRESRNTVAEVGGLKTLDEITTPWKDDLQRVSFLRAQSINWLMMNRHPIDFAFVDGKHKGSVVSQELDLLSKWQKPGAVVVLDDMQIEALRVVVARRKDYDVRFVKAIPGHREYAIARRL